MLTGINWTSLLHVVFGISAVLFAWATAYQSKRLKRLRAEFSHRIRQLSDTREQALSQGRHEAQENTLLNIARELHDSFNMRLLLASMYLKQINWDDHQQARQRVKDSIEQLNESIQGLSEFSRSMNSDLIRYRGLVHALEKELQRIQKAANFQVQLHVTGKRKALPELTELSVFRIIQECFNNIIKHSGTNLVQLNLTYLSHQLEIMVIDYGVGFNQNDPSITGSGSGLQNLQSRLTLIHGHMKIKSVPDEGTSLTIKIPKS